MFEGLKTIALVPAYNERAKIGRVVARMPRDVVDEVLVIDDGSDDASGEVAREAGARVERLPRTIGVGAALRRGIEIGIEGAFDVAVFVAGNDKDDPSEIPRLLAPIASEGYDFVMGSRYLAGGGYGGDMPFYRKIATRLHPWLFGLVTGKRVTESTNGFRAFRLSLARDPRIRLWQDWLDGYELEPYLYYKAVRLGYRTTEVPVTKIYPPRALGITKMPAFSGWWSILRPLVLLPLGIKS